MDWKSLLFGQYVYERASDDGRKKFILTIKGGLVNLLLAVCYAYILFRLGVFLWQKFFG